MLRRRACSGSDGCARAPAIDLVSVRFNRSARSKCNYEDDTIMHARTHALARARMQIQLDASPGKSAYHLF